MESTICCYFNYPPHYRKAIYEQMDTDLKCHFYFGDKVPENLKEMDISSLKGFKKRFKNIIFMKRIIWQTDLLKILFLPYKNYILSVDTASISSWIFIFLSKFLNKKVYFWTHGTYGNESLFQRIKNLIYFKSAKGLLLYGNYAKNILIKRGFDENKLFVIGNSLDYNLTIKVRNCLQLNSIYKNHFNNSFPTIIFIGRLLKKKKLKMILDVMHKLKKEGIYLNFVLIGEGEEKKKLEKISINYGLISHVWFYGSSYNEEEIGNLIYNSDVCVSPGNVGLTAVHSLSYGTPVITHSNFSNQMPEFEAIKANFNGDFFDENNTESLYTVLKNWIEMHPKKDIQLINNCFQVIDIYYNPYYQIKILKKKLNLND